MHAAVKIIIGLIFILIGLGIYVDSVYPLSGTVGVFGVNALDSLVTVLAGVIPILLILLGLFIVWLEADELKTAKEFEEPVEEKPEKK
ncbi:MAG: hypothetical protein KAT94_00595 [Candidatus Aenigmarchaeota archaeon]|nr:hypothetical protein [Candidatus Aenigmarchaeota archaeon]MCK4531343.1 hypothetical protein [Candidatus Aenigmarchaeota archaeon]